MHSMTGFVFDTLRTEQGIFSFTVRSLNHRYLDVNIKLPETFKVLESDIRQLLLRHLKRGKVEFALKFSTKNVSVQDFSLNKPLVDRIINVFNALQQTIPHATVELTHLLNWPGVLIEADDISNALQNKILKMATTIVTKLMDIRQKEGHQLKQYIHSMLKSIECELKTIKKYTQAAVNVQKEKLLSQLQRLKIELDESRFAQEVTLLAQKVDIKEEVDRLETYLNEANKLLQKREQVGRRLDFLMQELNREANTICSKSSDVKITQAAIEIKVLIDQIREQAQNIE